MEKVEKCILVATVTFDTLIQKSSKFNTYEILEVNVI